MNIHCFQHVPFEGLGCIQKWIASRGHCLTKTQFFINEELPSLNQLDWLIVMGGPMDIFSYRKFPWLLPEKRFIEKAIKAEKTVIGICLGAQLVTDVLGAKVYKNRYKEIGWHSIQMTEESLTQRPFKTFPGQFNGFHWHGDTFDLPENATHLMRSIACENQAYIYEKRLVGLQFHLEITRESLKQIIANCSHELVEGPFIQSADSMLSVQTRFDLINDKMVAILHELENRPR